MKCVPRSQTRGAAYQRERYYADLDAARARGRENQRQVRKKRKELTLELVGSTSCVECGEDHIACLHIHHTKPELKKHNFNSGSINVTKLSTAEVQDELRTCTVLCANCHAKYHYHV